MEVHLAFTARSQYDEGGELRNIVLLAREILERDVEPPGAFRLTPDQIREYTALPADDDDEVEDMSDDEIWAFELGGRKVLFAPVETDETAEPARQLILVV